MNYAAAFLALIFLFSTVYWYISGRKFYVGPLTETGDGQVVDLTAAAHKHPEAGVEHVEP